VRWRPRVRTVLLAANLLVLLFPLGGVLLMRVYESVLIRRAETELQVQGAVLAATYRAAILRELAVRKIQARSYGFGRKWKSTGSRGGEFSRRTFEPLVPSLDLSRDPIYPVPGRGRRPQVLPDEVALAAGAQLAPVLKQVQRSTLAGIRVLDHRGTVVASTRSQVGLSIAGLDEVRRGLTGERVSVLRKRHQRTRRVSTTLRRYATVRVFVVTPVIHGDRVIGAVLLMRTPATVRSSLLRRAGFLVAAVLAVLAVALALTLLASWTVSRPIRALVVQAERVARGERGAVTELDRPGTREVRQLSVALVKMSEAQEDRAQYIRTFASNVSHEFKTPLTALRGAVELLRDHGPKMTEKERDRFLSNVQQDVERLDRLVGRLLELARADVVEPADCPQPVAPVVERLVTRFVGEGLDVRAESGPRNEGEDVAVRMEPEALESVLANLMENARQHGGDGVAVVVAWREVVGEDERRVEFAVRDDGPGISAANIERVFGRFFTTARAVGGSGLGLSIVKALVEGHDGKVTLQSAPGQTVFTVSLPSAKERESGLANQ
jgi:signal transduction histidine kinase